MATDMAKSLQDMCEQFHDMDDMATVVAVGTHTVNAFHPRMIAGSDAVMLMSTGCASIAALQHNIEGYMPDDVYVAIMRVIVGAYGLGKRRGMGHILRKKHDPRARLFIDPITYETLPLKRAG